MSPKEARVFVAERDQYWRDLIKNELEKTGHKVVLEASTMNEALAATQKLNGLGIQVATICGTFNNYSDLTDIIFKNPGDISCLNEALVSDGRKLSAEIKRTTPNIKTIGITGFMDIGADTKISKFQIEMLGDTVTRL